MDKLENIFELQDVLNRRIGVNMDEMNDEDRTKWILNYVRAMQQELAELTDSVPWKWWAKYQEFDKQNAKVEIVDLFHFLISLAQVMGMSADDVHEAYLKKNKVNHNRQESGYSEKNEDDSRHIYPHIEAHHLKKSGGGEKVNFTRKQSGQHSGISCGLPCLREPICFCWLYPMQRSGI